MSGKRISVTSSFVVFTLQCTITVNFPIFTKPSIHWWRIMVRNTLQWKGYGTMVQKIQAIVSAALSVNKRARLTQRMKNRSSSRNRTNVFCMTDNCFTTQLCQSFKLVWIGPSQRSHQHTVIHDYGLCLSVLTSIQEILRMYSYDFASYSRTTQKECPNYTFFWYAHCRTLACTLFWQNWHLFCKMSFVKWVLMLL